MPVFSLRWSLPPALGCIPKQPDSGKTRARRAGGRYRPHTVHGLGLDQKDLGPPRAAPGSGSSVRHISRAAARGGPRLLVVCSNRAASEQLRRETVEAVGSGGSRRRLGGCTSRSWSGGEKRRRRPRLRGGGRSRLSPLPGLGTPESCSLPFSCLQHGGGGGGTSRDPGRC